MQGAICNRRMDWIGENVARAESALSLKSEHAAAVAAKDWPEADRTKKALGALGVTVTRMKDGSVTFKAHAPAPFVPTPAEQVFEMHTADFFRRVAENYRSSKCVGWEEWAAKNDAKADAIKASIDADHNAWQKAHDEGWGPAYEAGERTKPMEAVNG